MWNLCLNKSCWRSPRRSPVGADVGALNPNYWCRLMNVSAICYRAHARHIPSRACPLSI